MDMIPVASSNVDSIGYDSQLKELHVRFRNTSGTYVYLNVPIELFRELRDAKSVGGFLNSEIKPTYRCEKR